MPEMRFSVRWPDGSTEECYSPSLVIKDHLAVGVTYSVADFRHRSRIALSAASDRVREKYGFSCSRAMAQLARIEAATARFEQTANAGVTVTSFDE
jgi:uncharacterized repeat protein (TIGR04042 family)